MQIIPLCCCSSSLSVSNSTRLLRVYKLIECTHHFPSERAPQPDDVSTSFVGREMRRPVASSRWKDRVGRGEGFRAFPVERVFKSYLREQNRGGHYRFHCFSPWQPTHRDTIDYFYYFSQHCIRKLQQSTYLSMSFDIECNCLTSATAAADEETRDRNCYSNYQSDDSDSQDPGVMS